MAMQRTACHLKVTLGTNLLLNVDAAWFAGPSTKNAHALFPQFGLPNKSTSLFIDALLDAIDCITAINIYGLLSLFLQFRAAPGEATLSVFGVVTPASRGWFARPMNGKQRPKSPLAAWIIPGTRGTIASPRVYALAGGVLAVM